MSAGSVVLVLHAHLPFVRHLDRDDRLEEVWLFEALTETYIPWLQRIEALAGAEGRGKLPVTVSLSPPLMAMLADPILQARYRRHLDRLLRLADQEQQRTRGKPPFDRLSRMYAERFASVADWYLQHDGDVLGAFGRWASQGWIELWTTAATHAFLPYLAHGAAVRRQIETGLKAFEDVFGRSPKGFWLPECGYRPGLERFLGQSGIDYTALEPQAGPGFPETAYFYPFAINGGEVAALARAPDACRRIWDAHGGYPGAAVYRDFYRDIGFDLSEAELAGALHPAGVRRATGFKYWRITGAGDDKEPYDPERASAEVRRQAADFAAYVQNILQKAAADTDGEPVLTLAFDAELFGHWWFEGIDWLAEVLPKLPLSHPAEVIPPASTLPSYPVPFGSWGRGGGGAVWCNPKNDWLYSPMARAESAMEEIGELTAGDDAAETIAAQAVRELLLAESSDWAFMLDAERAPDYAVERMTTHLDRLSRLWAMLRRQQPVDPAWVAAVCQEDRIFPKLTMASPAKPLTGSLRVLMLSWEYPPNVVGGLGQHVDDLSRYLAARGVPVTVVTAGRPERTAPWREEMAGVGVVRAEIAEPQGANFWDWVLAMNLALFHAARDLGPFDLLHGHDWLVGDAAMALHEVYGWPLLVTMHATERGRQGGIHTPLQRLIDDQERRLAESADLLIACSRAMRAEILRQWRVRSPKIRVVPNGVDPGRVDEHSGTLPQGYDPGRRWLVFLGRLVPEKGIDVLLAAMPEVVRRHPQVMLAVLGAGPYQAALEAQAQALGIADHVRFLGFVGQEQRNRWLAHAEVSVFPSRYEPFGIAVLESMAAGVPVVATPVGGMAEFLRPGKNALSVPVGDAAALSGAVAHLLDDPADAAQLSLQAARDARHFNWDRISRHTEHLYRRLVRAPRIRS